MLSCSVWFSVPSFWMDGGLKSRCIGGVYGADGESHGTIRTVNTTHAAALSSTNSVQKTICCNLTSSAPDDGRMCPKHVELRIYQ